MLRNTLLAAAAALTFAGSGATARAGGTVEVKRLVVGKLIEVVADLATRPGTEKATAVVTPLTGEGKNKLVFFSKTYRVSVKRSHEKWNGDVHVTVTTSARVGFALDLNKVGGSQASWDPGKRRLAVTLPRAEIDTVECSLKDMKFEVVRTGLRFGWFNSGLEQKLREKALGEVEAEVRRCAEADLPGFQAQGREALGALLHSLLRQANPDVEVLVK